MLRVMDLQLACSNLGRRAEVRDLIRSALGRHDTDDSVMFDFATDDHTARTILEFVVAERRCCAHFTYEIAFAPQNERLSLRVGATGDYLVALKAMYAP
jgi:hypothetical protein